MIWDFAWINDPSAWIGLGTLIVIEIVLGIDNIVFISILSSRLPENQKQSAFTLGLTLALLMRLVLLSAIAWIVSLTQPLMTVWGQTFSARDLILLVGGLFLLLKGTVELHERLEGGESHTGSSGRQAVFWQVVAQILVLDAIFSLDSVITSVGMVRELPVMMLAVVVSMATMLVAARPLMNFVNKHPSVIVLCLGFLLMIGLSLIMDGFGLHVPKGYLYAAIAFSVLVEAFNQLALRNRRLRLTRRNLRESAAKAVLGLLGGQNGTTQMDMAAIASDAQREAVFAPEERDMLARAIRIGGRSVRYIMTPRRRMPLLTLDADRESMIQAATGSALAFIPVHQRDNDDIPGVVPVGDMLAMLARHEEPDLAALVQTVPIVSEHLPLPDLLDGFRAQPAPLVLVQDEYGSVVGMVTPESLLHAMAGHMGELCGDAVLQVVNGCLRLPGRLSIDEASRLLGMPLETDAATLAGFILEQRGHIPTEGERWNWCGRCWKILRMDGLRVDEVAIDTEFACDVQTAGRQGSYD